MIIKLTTTGRNETIFVNFDYVRTMRSDGAFTELVMSDDKYHKLAVVETPEEIYDRLYPPKTGTFSYCSGVADITADSICVQAVEPTPEAASIKKSATKKTSTKTVEEH